MNLLTYINHYRLQNPLGVRLLAAILLCSSLITLIATGTQLWLDYRYELSSIDERIRQIEASSLNSLTNSLWEISPAQVQVQLDGLNQLPDVAYLEITSQFNDFYASGTKPSHGPTVERLYPLIHIDSTGTSVEVGKLALIVSLEDIYKRLSDKVLVILTSQGIKTFIVSIFILTIFHRLVTQHLSSMANYARQLRLDHLDVPLSLKRRQRSNKDELNDVTDAMNAMRESMLHDMGKREEAERSLAKLNEQLEQRVIDRTRQLEEKNRELSKTLNTLKTTQQQLVESEKLAALGSLVAGIAHEINTPIGIGYTAASFLSDQAKTFQQQHPDNSLAATAVESSQMICQNLERANKLINAFKQVSVDQSSEQKREFDLIKYMDEILLSLNPKLKQSNPTINIDGPESLVLQSYPGCFYQIFTNLIINSLLHGFNNQGGGSIEITFSQTATDLRIDYKDNGVGIDEEWQHKVFEPFTTTKRGQGCTGLGMHVTFNLVSQLLKGHICCLQHSEGAHFRMDIPLNLPD